ncbi:MAG: sigma 54-interacting transcriptional regulator [Geminicoccaceae bacterium]
MKVLVIGANRAEIPKAIDMATAQGADITHVETIATALGELRSARRVDLLLVDVEADIENLIRALTDERILTTVVAYGVDADARTAVRAIQAGAQEFIPLPPDKDLIAAIFHAVADDEKEFIFEDPIMRNLLAVARRIAPSDASVLITGESGTGKEMVARYVHQHSRRHAKRLVSVNCAAIPDNLLESELFGHEKGAFTGANARRIGKFEEADGGTLLLDEISEMAPRLQAKLLRAIQEREIDRVGGTQPVRIDIRLIATSNRDLPAEVAEGRFREDLFFRLNVVQLELPALRDRPGDIGPLSQLFVKRYGGANGLPSATLSPCTLDRLRRHQWKGNVRELENCIYRAVLLSQDKEIKPDAIMLPGEPGAPAPTSLEDTDNRQLVGKSMAEVEQRLILDTLEHTLGNRTHAATILGISIRTLRNKLRQYSDDGIAVSPSGSRTADCVSGHV